ncbi:hypothetical protein EVA_16451, partial [gut metagenome]
MPENESKNSEKASIVRFTLGGSAGSVKARAAAGVEVHSAQEKEVRSIYAVVFNDSQAGTVTSEQNTDQLYRCVEAKTVEGTSTYEFEVG